MAVNESIYGAKNQWFDAYFQQAQLTEPNKTAYFGTNAKTLDDAVTNNKLTYDKPIDKSLSYCGIGAESAMSHTAFLGVADGTRKVLNYNDRSVTNFAFFEKESATNFTSIIDMSTNNVDRYAWTDNMETAFNYTGDLKPLTVVNPHNIILYISIAGRANLSDSVTETSFSYYMSSLTQSWNYISAVYVTAYYGNVAENVAMSNTAGRTGTANKIPLQIALLDEYVCEPKNTRFYMYGGYEKIPVFGFIGRSYIENSNTLIKPCFVTESAKSHIKISGGVCYLEYYDGFVDDVLKTVACFGLYFTPNLYTAQNGDLTNNSMYIGLLDADGVGRGRYLQGAATATAPQAQSSFKDMHDVPYDYKAVDNSKYQNDTEFYTSALADGFTRFWVMNSTGVDALLAELYDIMNDDDPDISIERYNMKVFLTQNPIDAVISLKKFPIDNIPSISGAYFINIGAKSTNISASPLAASCGIYTFSFSSASDTSLYPHYNNSFLDYEPYTKAELYIPFCGTYEIPCTYLYDYGGVDVKLIIDFISGACTGYVICNGICIGSCSGSCAITLPLSGIQSATLDSQIHSASVRDTQRSNTLAASIAAGAVSIAAGIFTGGTGALIGLAAAAVGIGTAAVKSATEQAQIEYEVSHMQTPLKQVSAASGQIAHTYDMRAKLTISRPKKSGDYDAEVYANTVGFACIINDKIKNLSGLTQGTVHFKDMMQYDGENNIIATCTDTEKELIRNAFAGGVIL